MSPPLRLMMLTIVLFRVSAGGGSRAPALRLFRAADAAHIEYREAVYIEHALRASRAAPPHLEHASRASKHAAPGPIPDSGAAVFKAVKLFAYVGQKSDVTGAFDRRLELSLMLRAGSADAAGKNLAVLADELAELSDVLVVDIGDLVLAENANFSSAAVGRRRAGRTCRALFIGLSFHCWYSLINQMIARGSEGKLVGVSDRVESFLRAGRRE